jgi:predicted nucleic acid-binding protein
MTEQFVVDASATLAWLLREADGERIKQLIFQGAPVVPWLWRIEVANTLLVQERRKRLSEAHGTGLLRLVDEMDVEVVPEPGTRSLVTLAQFARPHQLTSYDAVYLELAVIRNLPLLTLDRNLRSAAERIGLPLL